MLPLKYLPSKIVVNIVITLLWMPLSNQDDENNFKHGI
jgi:hypothetical protein